MTRPLVCALALLVACDCSDDPTDEERLREMVDTTSVHLYVAAKVALTKGDDPVMTEARDALMRSLEAFRNLNQRVAAGGTGADLNAPLPDGVEALGDAADATAAVAPAAESHLSLEQVVALGSALWDLRETGASIVRGDSEDELLPVLPIMLRLQDPNDPVASRINLSTDHALFFLGLWALKIHPKNPMPIPHEVLLYEASHVQVNELAFEGIAPVILGLRAQTYATAELCDLAGNDVAALLELSGRNALLQGMFEPAGGSRISAEQAAQADAALRGLAHGSTARCYLMRGDEAEAREELEHFCDAAEASGVPPEDVALVRAYLAYRADDMAGARRLLELAKTSDHLEDADRADIDDLIAHLDRSDSGFLDGYFDQVFFGKFVAAVTWRSVERTGVVDSISETETYRSVRGFSSATGQALGAATSSAQGAAQGAADKAGALWRSIRGE